MTTKSSDLKSDSQPPVADTQSDVKFMLPTATELGTGHLDAHQKILHESDPYYATLCDGLKKAMIVASLSQSQSVSVMPLKVNSNDQNRYGVEDHELRIPNVFAPLIPMDHSVVLLRNRLLTELPPPTEGWKYTVSNLEKAKNGLEVFAIEWSK